MLTPFHRGIRRSRAPRFDASQTAESPRRQTRAGRFGGFPAPCAHASTAAVVFRVTRPRGTSRRDLPRPALRRVPICGSAALPDARRSVRKVSHAVRPRGHNRRVLPHPAPRRQTRAGRFERFPTPCAHASTAAVITRVTRPRGTSRRDLPRPALRRVPIRESAASPDARRSVRKFSRAVRPHVHSRRVLPHPAPRRQTRAGQFGRFPTPCAHAATTAAFFRTPRRVGRRAPVASEGFPRRAPTRSQPLWFSAPRASPRPNPREHRVARRASVGSKGFPRRVPTRPQPPRSSAPRASPRPNPRERRVGRRAPVGSEGFPRRAPTRPQPPCSSAPRAASADARQLVRRVYPRHAPTRP